MTRGAKRPWRSSAWVALVVVGLSRVEGMAFADNRSSCIDAAGKGQSLRDAHKLVEARDQFLICAAPGCPSAVRADCTVWVSESERAIPTIVLAARDAAGNDVFDVSVSIDEAVVATKLDGAAMAIDPGPHDLHFARADGSSADRQVLIPEGQKAMVVTASLSARPPPPAPPPPPPPSPPPTQTSPDHAPGVPWHPIGWVAGGLGIAGLAVGGVFTAMTLSDRNAAQCDPSGSCANYGSIDSAKSAARVAGAGLIGGGALLVTGVALLFFTDESPGASRASRNLRMTPQVGAQSGGLTVEGAW